MSDFSAGNVTIPISGADPPIARSMIAPSSDIAFTPAIKAIQAARGSRDVFARMEARGGFRTAITEDLVEFLAGVDTAYLATASAEGQPYAQHRGGPKGFIRVVDDHTIGFADFAGNRQFISTGNLGENDRAFLFLMDYAQRRRIKLWGRARVVENDTALQARLMPEGYRAKPEQVILFTINAWDTNCSQHIPKKIDGDAAAAVIGQLQQRISDLEAEITKLKQQAGPASTAS